MSRHKSKTSPLTIIAIVAAGIVIFAASLWFTFPFDKIERRVEAELSKKGITADLSGLSPGFMAGLRADSLQITQYRETPFSLTIAPLKVAVRLSPLMSGKLVFDVEGETLGGQLSATAPLGEGEASVSFKDLSVAALSDDNPDLLPIMEGKISGVASASLPLPSTDRITGELSLDLASVTVGPGQVGLLSINQIALGSGKIAAKITEGKAEIESFYLTGGDLELKASGTGQLAEPIKESSVDMTLNIKPASPAVVAKLPLLFAFIAPNKNPDGSYTTKLKGAFASPRLRSN